MNSKALGAIVAFTALTTALNFVRIPVPFLPGYSYQLGDIAIVIALLLFGLRVGVTVGLLNMLLNMTVFVSAGGIIGAVYYFISILALFFGIFIFERLIRQKVSEKCPDHKVAALCTACGVLSRTVIMLVLDITLYGYLFSVASGLDVSKSAALIFALIPGIIVYNITVALYVIPTSYYIATRVTKTTLFATSFSSGKKD